MKCCDDVDWARKVDGIMMVESINLEVVKCLVSFMIQLSYDVHAMQKTGEWQEYIYLSDIKNNLHIKWYVFLILKKEKKNAGGKVECKYKNANEAHQATLENDR